MYKTAARTQSRRAPAMSLGCAKGRERLRRAPVRTPSIRICWTNKRGVGKSPNPGAEMEGPVRDEVCFCFRYTAFCRRGAVSCSMAKF